jgi:hypothetical protein
MEMTQSSGSALNVPSKGGYFQRSESSDSAFMDKAKSKLLLENSLFSEKAT